MPAFSDSPAPIALRCGSAPPAFFKPSLSLIFSRCDSIVLTLRWRRPATLRSGKPLADQPKDLQLAVREALHPGCLEMFASADYHCPAIARRFPRKGISCRHERGEWPPQSGHSRAAC